MSYAKTCECCQKPFESRVKHARFCKSDLCQQHRMRSRSYRYKQKKRGEPPRPYLTRLWSEEEDDLLYRYGGAKTAKELAIAIHAKTSKIRTPGAIWKRMEDLGIRASDNLGHLTVYEAARQIGCTPRILEAYIKSHDFPVLRRGRYVYVTQENFPALQARFAPPKEPTLSTGEAGRRLGFCGRSVANQIREGRLEAYRVGAMWRVPVRVVAQILWERRKEQAASSSAKRTA